MLSLFNYNILSLFKNVFYFFHSLFTTYYNSNISVSSFISSESLHSNKTISYVDLEDLNDIENGWEDIGVDTGYGWQNV